MKKDWTNYYRDPNSFISSDLKAKLGAAVKETRFSSPLAVPGNTEVVGTTRLCNYHVELLHNSTGPMLHHPGEVINVDALPDTDYKVCIGSMKALTSLHQQGNVINRESTMYIVFTKPTLYVSHPIRGQTGDIQSNCKKALACGRRLKKVFPEIDFYIPAASDLTLQILTHHNRLSIEDIMFADLQILRACYGYLSLAWEPSVGSEIERKEAEKIGLTTGRQGVIYNDLSKASFGAIRQQLNRFVKAAVKRFRSNQ